ncbi:aminotransferase-like domain-containing protein [Ideonella sp. BN130291]|uniref:aminotransferase-like domain-containing protein n=1 Tax=Ideonella sp. BN130291 TaxID=3112940 RepID=UPI002E269E1F|nr:PLP-dependent aminotransferase family protein [Ideonella sp. BN130291]
MSEPSPTLYRQLADHYLQAIGSGALAEGDRLPSVRRLMRIHRVSLSTALQACRHLESSGWLEARPRLGYFVRRPRRGQLLPAAEPGTATAPDRAAYLGIHAKVSSFIASSQEYPVRQDLAMAVCAPQLYPAAALEAAARQVLRQTPALFSAMAIYGGHPPLKAALVRRLLTQGVQAAPEDVIVTHGCVQSLNLALRAVAQPGDTIAVESPSYYGLLQIIESMGLRAIEVPTSPHTGLSLEALEYTLDGPDPVKAVVCMPTLHNPLGSVMPDEHKQRLVALCARRDIALIEDAIYADLADANSSAPVKPAKAWDRTGHVIHCNSFNKVLSPGLRLGWMLAGRWHARVEMLKYVQTRSVEELAQRVATNFLAGSGYDRHLQRLRAALRCQREDMAEAVAQSFPEGTRMSLPPGGMMLWVELPRPLRSQRLFERALERGIRVAPGSLFSNSQRFDHFLRLSCGSPVTADTRQGVAELGEMARQLAAP